MFFKNYTLHIPCYSCMQKNKPIGFLYHSKTVKKIALQKKEQGHFAPFFLNKYKYMYMYRYMYMRTKWNKWNKCSKISAVYRLITYNFSKFLFTVFISFFEKINYFCNFSIWNKWNKCFFVSFCFIVYQLVFICSIL